jgi:exonuclease III
VPVWGRCNQVSSGELEKYKLDLVGIQEVRCEGEYQRADNYKFFYGKWNANYRSGTGFLYKIELFQ